MRISVFLAALFAVPLACSGSGAVHAEDRVSVASTPSMPSGRAEGMPATPPGSTWDADFAAFAASDAVHPPPAGGIVFVGSSSIRLWADLETSFAAQPVILKRGFGGSQLSDCVRHLNRLVVRYRPRTVVVYAGDNDLAAGAAPAQVRQRFAALADGIRRELPDTRIVYISIKPSPGRVALMASIRATNDLVREYTAAHENMAYVDVFTPMLDAEGAPRAELFRDDALHLNTRGYALWKSLIAPYL